MTLPINALREAAELAEAEQRGPFAVRSYTQHKVDVHTVLDRHGMWVAECGATEAIANHIALWHPAQALAVLDEIDRLERQVAGLEWPDKAEALRASYQDARTRVTLLERLLGEACQIARHLAVMDKEGEVVDRVDEIKREAGL